MKFLPQTHLFPFAEAPLRHLADSLNSAFADRDGPDVPIAWNTVYPDRPETIRLHLSHPAVLCMETPLLARPTFRFDGDKAPTSSYYRIALHDPTGRFGVFPWRYDHGRLQTILTDSGQSLLPWRDDDPEAPIIYVTQVPGDTSLKGLDTYEAAFWDLLHLRRLTDRPVLLSIHPDCLNEDWAWHRFTQARRAYNLLRDLVEQLDYDIIPEQGKMTRDYFPGAHLVITQTSGTGVEALIHGIPAIATGASSFLRYDGAADEFLNKQVVTSPRKARGILSHLPHNEYSWSEISRGTHLAAIDDLLDHIPPSLPLRPSVNLPLLTSDP